jgi:hypothetical protein
MSGAGGFHRAGGVREGTEETEWTTRRFSVTLPGSFDAVIGRFESLVAAYPRDEFAAMLVRDASWHDILVRTEALAPLGFLLYWKNDVRAMMTVASDSQPCVAYLMGNHTIAEQMFRFDGRIVNYAPLRVEFTADPNGQVWFTFDHPRAQFASFGIPAVKAVGEDLDRKLGTLVEQPGRHCAAPAASGRIVRCRTAAGLGRTLRPRREFTTRMHRPRCVGGKTRAQ